MRRRALLGMALALALGGCSAPYEVLVANDAQPVVLGQQTLQVIWRGGATSSVKVIKQEKGNGLHQPIVDEAENRDGVAIGRQIYFALANQLGSQLARQLHPYIAAQQAPGYQLVLELASNIVNTQGTKEVVVMAHLHALSQPRILWARSIKLTAPRDEAASALVPRLASAIVEQMRSSKLIA